MAPRTPQDPKPKQKTASQILDEAKPFDWHVGDEVIALPPVGDIPGGGNLIMRSIEGEITESQILRELFVIVEDEVPGAPGALEKCTIRELTDVLDNWLRSVDAGE